MTEIKGIIATMQIVMHEDGSVNGAEQHRQTNQQIAAGVGVVFCPGTNGEFYIMSIGEKIHVTEIFVDEVKGRAPVYADTGCTSTEGTVALSRKAREVGVDVPSVITPYFAAISQGELYQHYAQVADSVDLPVVMHNIPARTGASLAPVTVKRLAGEFAGIAEVKDSSGNFNSILQYIQETEGMDFSVPSGNDALVPWIPLTGGKGGITAIVNILPTIMVDTYQNYLKGDMEKVREVQNAIPRIRERPKYGNPNSVAKCATNLIGQPAGPCRKPFGILPQDVVEGIREIIDNYYGEYKNK